LISLRPSYLEGVKVKLGFDEILGWQLYQGPVTSKRAVVEELVSPRMTKLPHQLDPPAILGAFRFTIQANSLAKIP